MEFHRGALRKTSILEDNAAIEIFMRCGVSPPAVCASYVRSKRHGDVYFTDSKNLMKNTSKPVHLGRIGCSILGDVQGGQTTQRKCCAHRLCTMKSKNGWRYSELVEIYEVEQNAGDWGGASCLFYPLPIGMLGLKKNPACD
jgi:hypothetical protein